MAAPTDRRMPLREHLQELKLCLIRCTLVIVALFVVGVIFEKPLLDFIWIPWNQARQMCVDAGAQDPGRLTYLGPAEGMMQALKVSFFYAVVVGAPFLLWELWHFIGVGLKDSERRAILKAFAPGVLLLIAGMAFGYIYLLPTGLFYLLTYLDPKLAVSSVTLPLYLDFVTTLTMVMGFVFETPLVMWAVVRAGLIRVATLRKSRRVAVIAILVFAAAATPGSDLVSMFLVAGPMLALFEIGLILGQGAEKARARAGGARL
ncbi:MAG TPA: twin-arginine translocase subunit TatC [Planctomycetota bacterium]|nr:twin-arginine translocase subunit TatC [Planctomycetota bacterium]